MIPKGDAFFPALSEFRLHTLVQSEKERKPQLRLLAALHRKQGWNMERIAASLEQPLTTVHDWLLRLHNQGLRGLHDIKQPGRPTELSRQQLRALERHLERGPPHNQYGMWTTKLVREHVRVTYGVEFTARHLRRILQGLGFSVQKPRPRHYKSDPSAQAHFKKKLDDSHENIDAKDTSSPVWTKARSASRRSSGAVGQSAAASR